MLLPGTEDAFLQPDVMASVRDCGVSGVVCYSPEYEMSRTHRLRSAAFSADLFCVGGSNGSLDWGRNSVSRNCTTRWPRHWSGQGADDFASGVVSGNPGDLASGVLAGSAQIEAGERRAIAG